MGKWMDLGNFISEL